MIHEPQMNEMLPKIKVVGVGHGAINAVNHMLTSGLQGVEFIVVDSYEQGLLLSKTQNRIQLKDKLPQGAGIIATEDIQKATEESRGILLEKLQGADLVFIVACLGGSTGTGASPIVAACAREVGALTIGVVTKPFSFEGKRRNNQAEVGIANLKDHVDTLIIISDDRLLQVIDRRTSICDAYRTADDALKNGVQAISDLIAVPGLITPLFTDVKLLLTNAGTARMGIGTAKRKSGAVVATKAAIKSPLLENVVKEARGLLVNVTCGEGVQLDDISDATHIIEEEADATANIIYGVITDNKMAKNEFKVTIVATNSPKLRKIDRPPVIEKKTEPWKINEITMPTDCAVGWIPRFRLTNEWDTAAVLVPRSDGKKICNYLKRFYLSFKVIFINF